MAIQRAYAGEDVAITQQYTEPGTDTKTNPDDTDSSGTPNVSVTITDLSDDSELITEAEITQNGDGDFEYVWDTEADANGPGEYQIETEADFDGETKIQRDTITLL